MKTDEKSAGAFLTIGELSSRLGIHQHILRFWETRFPQLRPLKRSGNRRYYRPDDVALVEQIDELLNRQGYTIAGARKRVGEQVRKGHATSAEAAPDLPAPHAEAAPTSIPHPANTPSANARFDRAALQAIRDLLANALERSRAF